MFTFSRSSSAVPVERIVDLYGPLLNQLSDQSFISRLVATAVSLVSATENEALFESKFPSSLSNNTNTGNSGSAQTLSEEVKEENQHIVACLKYWVIYFFQKRETESLENIWFEDISEDIQYLVANPQSW